MKNYETLCKEYNKVKTRIQENEKAIENLSLIDERRAAAAGKNYEEHEKLIEQFRENEGKILDLSNKVYVDKVTLYYIADNKKVALAEKCRPAITEVLTKYNGKPYGEKTSDKIRKELEALTNCYIYIHNNEITIREKNHYHDVVTITTKYDTPFIDKDNKINIAGLENWHQYEKYTEKPATAAKNLIKLYDKARAAMDQAEKALADFNHATPAKIDNKYINTHLYRTII